jgi:hypothetical protein
MEGAVGGEASTAGGAPDGDEVATGTAVESGGSGLLTWGAAGSSAGTETPATVNACAAGAMAATATIVAAAAVPLLIRRFRTFSPVSGVSPPRRWFKRAMRLGARALARRESGDAPCWARTSDPQLVELVLSQLS